MIFLHKRKKVAARRNQLRTARVLDLQYKNQYDYIIFFGENQVQIWTGEGVEVLLQILTCRMDIAQKYGTDAAVFLHNIVYWTLKNKAEDKHFHEGHYWMQASIKGLAALYPLWSAPQIKRIISRLREDGALLVGNFSEDRMVRTNWYAPSDEILALYEVSPIGRNRKMQGTESFIGGTKSENVYKEKEESKEDIPPIVPRDVFEICTKYSGDDTELQEAILGLLENRAKANKAPVKTTRSINGILRKLDKLSVGNRQLKLALLDKATVSNWLTVFPLKPDEIPASAAEGEEGVTYI